VKKKCRGILFLAARDSKKMKLARKIESFFESNDELPMLNLLREKQKEPEMLEDFFFVKRLKLSAAAVSVIENKH